MTLRGQINELILSMMIAQTFHIAPILAHGLGHLNHVNTIMIKHIRVQRLCEIKSEIRQTEQQKLGFEKKKDSWPSKGLIEYKEAELRYRPSTEIVLNKLSY
jgi:ABC-type bacteriocin/lantibiotic exporter with double-glycine peptidase domain